MKKLLSVLAFIAVFASSASAAAITWGANNEFKDPTGSAIQSGTVFLCLLEGATSTLPSFSNGAWDLGGATVLGSGSISAADGGYWAAQVTGLTYGTQYSTTAYYVSLITTSVVSSLDDVTSGFYCLTEVKQLTDGGLLPGQGDDDRAGQIWYDEDGSDSWVTISGTTPPEDDPTVPEPTVLALLALGVAGLALKRKVA